MKSNLTALWLSLVLCFSSVAQAAQVYIPLGQPSNAVNTGGFTGGALFRRDPAASAITFNSLGFIDLNTTLPTLLGPDGISGTYGVSLWRIDTYTPVPPAVGPFVPLTWTLLASTTVTPASPLSNDPSDTFRYSAIPATTINPGEYFIVGATLPAGSLSDTWLNGTNAVNFSGFTGPGNGYILSGGSFSAAGSPLFIANASTQVIPEPTCLSLLVIAGLMLLRRRCLGMSSRVIL